MREENAEQLIPNFNDLAYHATELEHPDVEFVYRTNGNAQQIVLAEIILWCSENDDRDYGIYTDITELQPFIEARVKLVLAELCGISEQLSSSSEKPNNSAVS